MPITTADQQQITVKAFLKRQSALIHAMTDLAEKRFIVDTLLRGGYSADGGVVPYTRSESIYLEEDPAIIEELGEYPFADPGPLALLEERVKKYGLMVKLSEEVVNRSIMPELDRALIKLRNTIVKYVDGLFLTKLVADLPSIGNTMASVGSWTATYSGLLLDVENAKQLIRLQFDGYNPDTMVVHSNKIAALTANSGSIGAATIGSKAPDNPIFTGQLPSLFGLEILHTPNLPSKDHAIIMERKTIGGIADEHPMEVRALPFNEYTDAHILKGRRVTATFLTDPKAATLITGVNGGVA